MRIISPTELETFNDCRLKHHYRYTRRLRPKVDDISQALASGRAVHDTLKVALTPNGWDTTLKDLAKDSLWENLKDVEKVEKYLPGVMRALNKIPQFVWEGSWHVEEVVEGDIKPMWLDEVITLRGRPDMWQIAKTPFGEVVQILDVKTTANNALDYMLWNPQLRLYAYCLASQYPGIPIEYQYVCVPTTSAPAQIAPPFAFTTPMWESVVRYVEAIYDVMLDGDISPRESRDCKFCDFANICKVRITGGNPESVISEEYFTKERENV